MSFSCAFLLIYRKFGDTFQAKKGGGGGDNFKNHRRLYISVFDKKVIMFKRKKKIFKKTQSFRDKSHLDQMLISEGGLLPTFSQYPSYIADPSLTVSEILRATVVNICNI